MLAPSCTKVPSGALLQATSITMLAATTADLTADLMGRSLLYEFWNRQGDNLDEKPKGENRTVCGTASPLTLRRMKSRRRTCCFL
jgi:hypothetical protein